MANATEDLIVVKYVRNADERATAGINFNDDDRPTLEIGGYGRVTQDELNRIGSFGIVLEVFDGDEQELIDAGLLPALPEPEPDLRDLPLDELKRIAVDEEGLDEDVVAKLRSKEQVATAIEEARSGAQEEGAQSLPATATTTVGTAGLAAGGGEAGPGGAPLAGPAGSGGGTA